MDKARLQRFFNQPVGELELAHPPLVEPGTPVREAIALMAAESHSCVLVSQEGRAVGILTERDVLSKCMAEGFDWTARVEAVASMKPVVIERGRPVGEAVATMRRYRYRTLPVVDEERRVLGIVRLEDLLRALAEVYPEEVLNIPPRPHQVVEKREGG